MLLQIAKAMKPTHHDFQTTTPAKRRDVSPESLELPATTYDVFFSLFLEIHSFCQCMRFLIGPTR
jgi:hypothetical protein